MSSFGALIAKLQYVKHVAFFLEQPLYLLNFSFGKSNQSVYSKYFVK